MTVLNTRVQPIPGMSRYTDTDTQYRYLYEKNRYELVSVRYGGYWGYRYWFGMEDMGDIGIGNPVSNRVFNVISVSKSV